MSSSDPPQLRISLPHTASTFKRSFDQFGFDLETPLDPTAVASSSGTDEHRPGPSNGDRNKRARSNSVTPRSAEQTHSMDGSPSSGSSHTISSGSSNHPVADHRDAPPAVAATRYPQTPETDPDFPSGLGGEFTHASSGFFDSRPLETSSAEPPATWSNPLSSTNSSIDQNDQFRLSMERFHAFDSQISSIRARPSQLPFRVSSNPPTLPPLTPSSPIDHSHSHTSPAASLPSVESLSYTSTSAQASASANPLMTLSSTTSPDQYHSDMPPLRFEEFGELREMMGFYQERNPNSPNIDRSIVRRRHQSPPIPDNSEQSRINTSFRRSPPRHITETVSRNNTSMQSWSSDRRGAVPDDSDDDFFGRPTVPMESRGPLDLPRSRLDSSLLVNRIRRSMENQVAHPSVGRSSPPLFSTTVPSPVESNSTPLVNGSRTQEPGRLNRHEPWSFHSPPRSPVFAEAVRSLTERLGRARQRNFASERRVERSRSPGAGAFSSSTSTAHGWPFGYPEFTSSEESPYDLDLPMPYSWFNEENTTSRQSIPTSRVQRDTSVSHQVPWRSSVSSNDTEDRFLSYLSILHRPAVTATTGGATQPDSDWRRLSSYTEYPPHPPSNRTSVRGNGVNDTPPTRVSHTTEHNTLTLEVGPGWWRSVPRAGLGFGPAHERDTNSVPNPSVSHIGDRQPTERPTVSMRDLVNRRLPQPPSRIPPHDQSTRRSSEVYQSVQPPEAGGMMAVDADVFRSDESSEVPFSSHAAALFASRATSSAEITSQRRPDTVAIDRINESYYPWASRSDRDFAFSAPRRHADIEERRHRNYPEPERMSITRRFAVAEHLASSAAAPRSLDIEEFHHGPFRATLERVERQERQDQQMMRERQDQQMMRERQAEIDRLRSRLDELQSQERPAPPTRAPTLPPLRFDTEFLASEGHRMPSPTPSASLETPSSFRADLEEAHRRRSWQRGRGPRPSWLNSGDEPTQWRNSSGLTSSAAPAPLPRAHSPPPLPLPDSRNTRPAVERERRRPGNLELWSPGDADDAMDSLVTPSAGAGFISRSLGRMREDFQSTDDQQPRRDLHGNPPWGVDPGRLALREPHADALRGIRPLWATHPPGSWATEARDEIPVAAGSGGGDAPVRGRRRRVNQSALPPQGRNVSEDERPPGARRASSSSRYATARRAIRDPVYDRFQRMVRGAPRESGFFSRYSRRNPGDFVRDEDFDTSYESLLSLAATIGEVRPRHTPDNVINLLPTGTFKEWRNSESDQRCPICLDDYQEEDAVMRLSDCPHWLHKNCLEQWLRGATTCPVCRQRVRCPQVARRDRGARADAHPGPSHITDQRGLDIAREIREQGLNIAHEIREQLHMAFPDINAAVSGSDAGPSGSGSEGEREIEQEVGDDVDMSLDWELAGAI